MSEGVFVRGLGAFIGGGESCDKSNKSRGIAIWLFGFGANPSNRESDGGAPRSKLSLDFDGAILQGEKAWDALQSEPDVVIAVGFASLSVSLGPWQDWLAKASSSDVVGSVSLSISLRPWQDWLAMALSSEVVIAVASGGWSVSLQPRQDWLAESSSSAGRSTLSSSLFVSSSEEKVQHEKSLGDVEYDRPVEFRPPWNGGVAVLLVPVLEEEIMVSKGLLEDARLGGGAIEAECEIAAALAVAVGIWQANDGDDNDVMKVPSRPVQHATCNSSALLGPIFCWWQGTSATKAGPRFAAKACNKWLQVG